MDIAIIGKIFLIVIFIFIVFNVFLSERKNLKTYEKAMDTLKHITNDVKKSIEYSNKRHLKNRNLILNEQINFQSIKLNYKVLNNIEIKNLNRINIFAGINNSGKTSLLEATFLLTKMNDIYYFFDVWQNRLNKSCKNFTVLNKEFKSDIKIEANINDKNLSLDINKYEIKDKKFNKEKYLNSFKIDSKFDTTHLNTNANIFDKEDNQINYEEMKHLCNSNFSIYTDTKHLKHYYEESIKKKSFSKIIDFLKEKVDKNIVDIKLVDDNSFLVIHNKFDEAVHLTQFGEGLQRIFYIALQFSASNNGVILIDELENGIHYKLLVDFASFIKDLSREFNVQVFITSHSKECINAFFEDKKDLDKISAYTLVKDEKSIKCKYINGEKLSRLIESIDADLRGAK